jgi:hypothetical protein
MKPRPSRGLLAVAGAAVIAYVCAGAGPALADDPLANLSITISPTYTLTTGSNATYNASNSVIPPNVKPAGSNANGYAFAADGGVTNDVRLDYGFDYQLSKKFNLFYRHKNVDFSLGRFQPGVYTGDIQDRFDTVGIGENLGHGLAASVGYFNRTRMCCGDPSSPGDNVLQNFYHGYFVGGTYAFGPKTAIGPPLSVDVKAMWVPRDPSKIIPGFSDDPAVPYVGSGFIYPASITLRIPVSNTVHTFWPFISYEKGADFMSGDPGPSYVNAVVLGVVKIFPHGLVFHAVLLNLEQEHLPYPLPQYPSVPLPGENVRINLINVGFDYKFHG